MKKPLVRVTLLESFRRYISGDYAYVDEQSVIDNITKKFEGNDYTRIGTAFHSIVETGKPICEVVQEGERHFTYYNKDKVEHVHAEESSYMMAARLFLIFHNARLRLNTEMSISKLSTK